MPKRNWTPEERKAFGDKMRAARAAKENSASQAKEPSPSTPDESVQVNADNVQTLLKRIEELESKQFFTPPVQQAVRAITKYSINPVDWPDPRERLADEGKLQDHAFRLNYNLKWEVGRVSYDKDGVKYTEPKFRLELWRYDRDADSGEKNGREYRVHKATFFEDPDAALQLASERGLEMDDMVQKPFLDEMRYLRFRDWLLEIFYPVKPQPLGATKEEVIGNRLVPVVEISSHEAQAIPLSRLRV